MKKLIKIKGQGLVEFALILPILLGILLGLVEASLVIQGHLAAQHIARETARWAVTYQPLQGACIDSDKDRHLADGGGGDDIDDYAPYPNCPLDVYPWADQGETDEEYAHRRVALIKQKALDTAAGLRIRNEYLGLTNADFDANLVQPGFFGVRVWGYPSFDTDCNDPDLTNKVWDPSDSQPGCLDHPGQEGLAVRVQVVHNVEIIDPLYRVIAEFVTVQADAQMINEGVQVGYGAEVPPGFGSNPNPIVGPPGGEETPVGPFPTNTLIPPTPTLPPHYTISLAAYPEGIEQPVNLLPDDRCHDFAATLTYEGNPIQNMWISLSTTFGAFNQSGTGQDYTEAPTNALGQAIVTLCGNEPGVADLRAWIDINGNDTWEGETSDTAHKTWEVPSGPYILVADHEVVALDDNSADIMNHPITLTTTYDVYWCVHPSAGPETVNNNQLLMTVTVDGSGNAENELFTVPTNSDGTYRLETHPVGGGGCGAVDLVAYSASIKAVVALPDLVISITEPVTICPETYFTMSATIQNLTSGTSDEYFDVDFYIDPVTTPSIPIGHRKQWVNGIGPFETVVVNVVLWVEDPGDHEFWARVDTSDFVVEDDESNNNDTLVKACGSNVPVVDDTGWRSPSGNYVGSTGFTNPDSAHGDGGGYAYRNNNADGVSHVYRDYGLNIPSNAVIQGIQVRLDWWLDSTYGTNRVFVYLSGDGGSSWTGYRTAGTERTGDGNPTDVEGGTGDTWGQAWSPSDFSNGNFRVRLELDTSSSYRDFRIDWVPVRVTYYLPAECPPGTDPNPWPPGPIKPPGLLECTQLLQYGNFEGSGAKVYDVWEAGPSGAYFRGSNFFHDGTLSMRLHTTVGDYPACAVVPDPHLLQTVTIPTEVYTQTTLTVKGYRLVADSEASCCYDTTDPDDVLYLKMRDGSGTDLGASTVVANGGVITKTWEAFEIDVTSAVQPFTRAGQDVQVYFHGVQDVDYDCTFFYLDSLECEACTYWDIPEPIPGTASFGGNVQVITHGGIPQSFQGVDVWAYSPAGAVYHTQTIHDGTYHFYNVPPGTYTIYAEYWEGGVGGTLHSTIVTVTVGADERINTVHLYL
ncbi:MAG: pilus assembly protein [Anaerolineae bacterium]|nr:pilus assembly protein [Anaerolineae bacterium]